MMNNYVLDTNIISSYLTGNKKLNEYVRNTQIYISFITEIELKSNSKITKNERAILDSFIKTCVIIDVNDEIKELSTYFIRNYKLKLPDAIIASTAHYLRMELISADLIFNKLDIYCKVVEL